MSTSVDGREEYVFRIRDFNEWGRYSSLSTLTLEFGYINDR